MNKKVEPGKIHRGKQRTCGFRLSVLDVVVLLLSAVVAGLSYSFTLGNSLFIPFVVWHFFLFCNVFRIPRKPELIWAALFFINCFGWSIYGQLNLAAIFCSQLIITVFILLREIRQPYYHGIFSRQINSQIDDYLSGNL